MKKLKKLNLSNLANADLEKREMNSLLGGAACCICGNGSANQRANNAGGYYSPGGGVGTGSYG